ncbi:hypothetical protein BC826DRAFT_1113951 [Russula brevipes]|nr:hypothetical protein BC826DRAFT_1113951 [Russula brevipes]
MNFPFAVGSGSQTWTHLPPSKDPPAPLNQTDFNNVKFWSKHSWNTYERAQKGATDGNAKKVKKRGRPEKETPDDDDSLEPNTTHIYLETEDGVPVSKAMVTRQGQRMRRLWATLNKHGLAPRAWNDADSFAVRFIDLAMLNDDRFHYLRLCEDNWKLKHWISKNYPSWARNHLVSNGVVKAKKNPLDNEKLLEITPDLSDNELRMTEDPPEVVPPEESTDALEDSTINQSSSSSSHSVTVLNITDPLRDDDDDESPANQTGMPICCPEVTPAQPRATSEFESQMLPPPSMDMHVDEPLAPTTTGAHEDGATAQVTVEATALSILTPTPNPNTLTDGPPQLADRPAPKKRKITGPAIVSDCISDKNLCRQDWLKSHEGGTEDEFRAHWLGLPEEDKKRWKQAASVQRKSRNKTKKKRPASTCTASLAPFWLAFN